jgi:hypothetical protein
MSSFLLALALLVAAPQQTPESKPVPKDSVEIATRGCLKGRVFTATPRPRDEGVVKGPDVTGRHFRLAGKRDVMDLVKKYDGQLVSIVGIVLKSAVSDEGMGMKIGGSRVTIGAPGMDPTRANTRTSPMGGLPTMDLTSVQFLSETCPIG